MPSSLQFRSTRNVWSIGQEPTKTSAVCHVDHNTLACGTSTFSTCYRLAYPEIIIRWSSWIQYLQLCGSTYHITLESLVVQCTVQPAALSCINLSVYLEEQYAVMIWCRVAHRHCLFSYSRDAKTMVGWRHTIGSTNCGNGVIVHWSDNSTIDSGLVNSRLHVQGRDSAY